MAVDATQIGAAPAPAASHSTEIPSTPAPASTAVAERPFMEALPAEYHDKAWAQDIAKAEKPWDAMFKAHANAQELLGKKSTGVEVPGEGATPEQVAAFNKAIGVPEKPEGYEYTLPDISKEPEAVQKVLTDRAANTGFIDAMRQEAHKAGITPKQFAALAAVFDGQTIAQVKSMIEGQTTAQKTHNDAVMTEFKNLYGDKADQVKQIAKDTIAKVLPESVRNTKDANLALAVLGAYIHEKLFKNDTIGSASLGVPGLSKDEIRTKISELRAKPGFRDPFAKDHKDLTSQVDGLYNKLFEKAPGE